jgi:hypothetical protein
MSPTGDNSLESCVLEPSISRYRTTLVFVLA